MTKQNYFLLVVLALLSICVLSETNLRSERAANIPTESKDDEVKILKKKEAATPLEYMLPKKRKLQDPGALARLMDVTRVEFSDGGGRYCIGFSPYVEDYAPGMSPPRDPPRELVDRLMTNLVNSGRIKCILSYGVNADVVSLAQEKGLEVILGTWIDIDPNVNAQQTEAAIELAKRYPETVIAVICGWEVRLRHNRAVAVDVVNTCYRRMKDAGLTIPITHMASWPEWCDEEFPGERFPQCGRWSQIDSDAVLVTAYSWWENQVVDPVSRFPCIVAEESANFHLDRLKKVIETYPDKPVILSEFGWPGTPIDAEDARSFQKCGQGNYGAMANKHNQMVVSRGTLSQLAAGGYSGVLFNAYNEPWKGASEGEAASHWGFCSGEEPFTCDLPDVPIP